MDIHELRKEPHLSASGIQDYLDCGLLYKFSRIDRFKPEHTAEALIFGKVIHKVMAEYNMVRVNARRMELDDMIDCFGTYWLEMAHGNEEILYSKGKNFNVCRDEGVELLRAFYYSVPDEDVTVLAVEEPFVFTIEGLDVPIIGVKDLVEADSAGSMIIADYKTAKKAYSDAQIHQNLQMTLYQMEAESKGEDPDRILLRLDCLIKTKNPKFEQYYTTRASTALARTRKKILTVWDAIQKGVFIPNETGWKCKTCAYKRYCNEWFDKEEVFVNPMRNMDLWEDELASALLGFG